MTKADIVNEITKKTGIDKTTVLTTVEACMDVAKISDDKGKGMCKNPDYVHYLNRGIKWRMENDK